jgi:hypothetical protein
LGLTYWIDCKLTLNEHGGNIKPKRRIKNNYFNWLKKCRKQTGFKGFCKIGFREHRPSFVAGAKEEKGKTKKK